MNFHLRPYNQYILNIVTNIYLGLDLFIKIPLFHKNEIGGLYMSIDIQAALYYYHLGLIKRENHLYCLVDLKTGEWSTR